MCTSWLRSLPPDYRLEPLAEPPAGIVLIHMPAEWADGDGMTLTWDSGADTLSDGGETAFRLWAFGDAPEDARAAYAGPVVEHAAWELAVRHPTSVESVRALLRAMQAANRWISSGCGGATPRGTSPNG